MTFVQAKQFVIPWGDFKGLTIDDAARGDGLTKLDKLLGWMEDKNHRSRFRTALEVYLGDSSMQKELGQERPS